ncbi:membrane protein [Spirochaetia bacterium]|nr:membrane protein [Spirochaetia bacterium]
MNNCFNKNKVMVLTAALLIMGSALFGQTAGQNIVKPAIADRDIVIEVSEVTENAVFYPVDIEGTRLEVLAVKAPDGTIRTAFNTCQVCYGSGRGFYKQQGTVLVCQNCGNRFRMSQVEMRSGGCNPVPIFPQNKTVTDNTITISKDFLKETKSIFARWRRG